MVAFKKIVIPVFSVLISAYFFVLSIVFTIHENRVKEIELQLDSIYKLNTYTSAPYVIYEKTKTIKYKVDSDVVINNDNYKVELINWVLTDYYEIFDKFDEHNVRINKTITTDNKFCVVGLTVTNLTSKQITYSLGEFVLKLVYGEKYDSHCMLDSNLELLATNESFFLEPKLKQNIMVIFEIPDDDYTIGNSPNKFVLINDQLFGNFDKKSNWNFIYEIKF